MFDASCCEDCFDVPPRANDDMVTGATHMVKYNGPCAFDDALARGPINGECVTVRDL